MTSQVIIPSEVQALPGPPHWLPVKAGKTCDAPVSEQFNPAPFTSSTGANLLEATLRGRQLKGQQVELPDGYCGLRLLAQPSSTASPSAGGMDSQESGGGQGQAGPRRMWEAAEQFGSLVYWNHDTEPHRADPVRRALDWLATAKQVHAPVGQEEVEAELQRMQQERAGASS